MVKTERKQDEVRNRSKGVGLNKRAKGTAYEQAAGYYLEQQGYEILTFNYRCPLGEIDIIAKEGGYLVFCEVKYRAGTSKGSPLEAVGSRKQRTIYRCAEWYLNEKHLSDVACRFDVIGVEGSKITVLKNAFEG